MEDRITFTIHEGPNNNNRMSYNSVRRKIVAFCLFVASLCLFLWNLNGKGAPDNLQSLPAGDLQPFSMLASWRRRAMGISYFAKRREAEAAQEMGTEGNHGPSENAFTEPGGHQLSSGQLVLAKSFDKLRGHDLSFSEMQEKYSQQVGNGAAEPGAAVLDSTEQPYDLRLPQLSVNDVPDGRSFRPKVGNDAQDRGQFQRRPTVESLHRQDSLPDDHRIPKVGRDAQDPDEFIRRPTVESLHRQDNLPDDYRRQEETLLVDAPRRRSFPPDHPPPPGEDQGPDDPLVRYYSTQPSEEDSPADQESHDFHESDGGDEMRRDIYGDPVPLSYPDQIPQAPAGIPTPEMRARQLHAAEERVRRAQEHLQDQWAALMRRPPPVTDQTRPDIIDPDDYATTSADFDRKRKEMLKFKAALMAFKSDPEFNPMIVMLAHGLARYGVPPPETDDIHVWQQWFREADDKFKLLQHQVEHMASGRWRDDETSWERHHLRRPGAYKTATRAEVRLPDDSFAGRQDVAAAAAIPEPEPVPAAAPGGGANGTAREGNGTAREGNGTEDRAGLEAEVKELARRLDAVQAQLHRQVSPPPAPVAEPGDEAPSAAGKARVRPSLAALAPAARHPPKLAEAAGGAAPSTSGGDAGLPPPPAAVVKWLADAFLRAEQASHLRTVPAPDPNPTPALAHRPPAGKAPPAEEVPTGRRVVECEAGECRPAAGRPATVRAAEAPPAVHVRAGAEQTPLMQTGPLPGRQDMISKGAQMLRLQNKQLPAQPANAAAEGKPVQGKAVLSADHQQELRRLAARVIQAGTMPSQPKAATPAATAAAPAAATPITPAAAHYNKVFVGGASMYVPKYDHTKTTDDGWGWLWG